MTETLCYLEHVAIRVRDIDWHVRFFREVLGMPVLRTDGPSEAPVQVWTVGGLQLVADPAFAGPEGRLAHLGIMAEDQEEVLRRARDWGVSALPKGRHWLGLPDGLCVEVLQASAGAVAAVLAIDPRA
jgi:catechol 2,3-dioxygenase-like lactoylglutathione lyase family enzyme